MAAAAPIIEQASRYVLGYGYRETESGLGLELTLDWPGLKRAMLAAQLPIWDQERPPLILWLGWQDGAQRNVIGAEAEVVPELVAAARRRGIDLIVPLMDLEDQMRVRTADVWAVYDAALREASARYGAETLLVGRLSPAGSGGWAARWDLLDRQSGEYFTTRAEVALEATVAAIDTAVDRLGARYSYISEASPLRYAIRLVGFPDAAAFGAFADDLRALGPIQSSRLVSVSDAEIVIEINALLQPRRLAEMLERTWGLEAIQRPGGGRMTTLRWTRPTP